MRVCVIGAGVVGISSAMALQERGAQVTLYEAESGPGQRASLANGAQLSFAYTDPLGSPALLRDLFQILRGNSRGIRLHHRADWHYLRWGAALLWHCLPAQQRRNTLQLEALAQRSLQLVADFNACGAIDYYRRQAGKLVLLDKLPDADLRESVQRKQDNGHCVRLLAREEAIQLEPSLTEWQPFVSAVHSATDQVADPQQFTQAAAAHLQRQGAELRFDQPVHNIRAGARPAVRLGPDQWEAFDALVLCTGNQSNELLKDIGQQQPIYPVTGYSVTLPTGGTPIRSSITALSSRLVFAPLPQGLRIAGYADVNPPNGSDARIDELIAHAKQVAPKVADYSHPKREGWVGHRPMTPSSVPTIGAASAPGIYLNVGHGMLGWTLAFASAEALAARVITGNG